MHKVSHWEYGTLKHIQLKAFLPPIDMGIYTSIVYTILEKGPAAKVAYIDRWE